MKRLTFLAVLIVIAFLSAHSQRARVNGGWVVTTDTNPMDSVKTVTALKNSLEDPRSTLVIRCKGRHAEVYVNTAEIVSSEYAVRVKFDQGKPTRQLWERSTGYDALFSSDPGDFLKQLKASQLFYFEYEPYGKLEKVVSFDVTSFPKDMSAACVTLEIERATARAVKAAEERVRISAQRKREREDSEKRQVVLRAECLPFVDESVERVERAESPLPPRECWEILAWTGSATYDEVAKKRELCKLPSFAKDPAFCGKQSETNSSADDRKSNKEH